MGKNYVIAFVTNSGKGWIDGEIIRFSDSLIGMNWDDAPTRLDEWDVQSAQIEQVGVYKFDVIFTGGEDDCDAYLANPKSLWIGGQPLTNAMRSLFRPSPKADK